MPVIIKPKITDAGLAAAINADATGVALAITHIALGTGVYDSEATGAGMTAMAARKEQVHIQNGIVSGTGACRINVLFNGWTGSPATYDATEIGFWAGDPDVTGSVLFAVFSAPAGVIVTRNMLDYIGQFVLQLTRIPAGSVTIAIDPSAVQAMALIALHENATNPHDQYVRKDGSTSTGPQRGLTAAPGDVSTLFATTAFVKRQGISYPASGGIGIYQTAAVLAPQDIGNWVELGFNGGNVTLPPAAATVPGGSFTFRVPASFATIVPVAGDVIITPLGEVFTSLQLSQGEVVSITRNAANNWYVTTQGFRMPAGIVSYFAGNNAPIGWLKLNGVLLSRAAYPALWNYAQSTGGLVSDGDWLNAGYSGRFSAGTNGSDFRIPDARGTFLRAFDDGRGFDPGRTWGTYQDHANRSHAHNIIDPGHAHGIIDSGHSHGIVDRGHIHALNDVGHSHVGRVFAAGSHTHSVTDPGHVHASQYNLLTPGSIDAANPSETEVGGFGTNRTYPTTKSVTGLVIQGTPDHNHQMAIDNSGAGLSVVSAAAGISLNTSGAGLGMNVAGTGLSMQNEGSEARPRNISWSLFIKF